MNVYVNSTGAPNVETDVGLAVMLTSKRGPLYTGVVNDIGAAGMMSGSGSVPSLNVAEAVPVVVMKPVVISPAVIS